MSDIFLENKIKLLEAQIAVYEQDGPAKLYYSLGRKSVEMADMLNAIVLKTIDIDDPKNKSFERIMVMIKNSTDIAAAVKSLGDMIGATGDEEKDTAVKKSLTPERIANVLADTRRNNS